MRSWSERAEDKELLFENLSISFSQNGQVFIARMQLATILWVVELF
jgi:hypothetical protein